MGIFEGPLILPISLTSEEGIAIGPVMLPCKHMASVAPLACVAFNPLVLSSHCLYNRYISKPYKSLRADMIPNLSLIVSNIMMYWWVNEWTNKWINKCHRNSDLRQERAWDGPASKVHNHPGLGQGQGNNFKCGSPYLHWRAPNSISKVSSKV